MSRIIQLRRDASTSWTAVNPTLTQGEFGYETDTNKFKIGNGVDDWNTLGYLFQGEEGGTVSYDDLSDLPTLFDGAYSSLTGTPTLATVAISGAYTDLSGTPTLATVATSGAYTDLSGTPTLATVATSGAYADITGTPSIPSIIGGSFQAVASGALANGDKVLVNADGTVSVVAPIPNPAGPGTIATFATNPNWMASTFDSNSNKVVIVYEDVDNNEYGTAVVGTVSGSTISFGSPVVFENSGSIAYSQVVFDSNSNKVVANYILNNSAAKAVVGTVSGTSISFGSPVTYTGRHGNNRVAFDANANKIAIVYQNNSNSGYGTVVIGDVSGTSISFGSPTVFNSANSDQPRVAFDANANKIAIQYKNFGNSYYLEAIVGTISGTSVSFGSSTTFESTNSECGDVVFDPVSNKVIYSYKPGGAYEGKAIVGTISGTSISFGSPAVFQTNPGGFNAPSGMSNAYDSSANKVLVGYNISSQGVFVAVGTVSGTSISFDTPVLIDAGGGVQISISYDSNSNKPVISYRSAASGEGKAVTLRTVAGADTYDLTAENYVGISDAEYANGATATIQTAGAVDDAQSGLTTGQAYFLNEDGTISTTAGDPSVFVGVALSSTEILIAKNDSGGGVSNYNDLTNLPTLFDGAYSSLTGAPTLATVATSGLYTDLTGTPSIPSALTDIGITDGTANQVLTTDGSGSFTFTDAASSYGNTEVDTHLNTGSASANQILSWNGSDYTWVEDQITSVGTSTVIAPFALANVDGTSGSGTGISYGSWNSGSGTLTFTFSSAQSDSNYIVMTDGEFTDDGRLASVSNKSTTGFQVSFYDSNGNTVTPSSFSRFAVVVYGSTPTTTVIGSGTSDVVDDTSPQLGGNLDVNGNDIVSAGNGDIDFDPDGSGNVIFKGNSTRGSGAFKLNCENNSHGITIKGPPHSANADYTLTLPNDDGNANQVLTTDGSGNLSWANNNSAGGGAWALFSSTTITSAVSQIDMALSSSYSTYMIVVDNLDPCGALYFRWKRGGTWIWFDYNYTETGTSIIQRTNQARFKIAGFDADNHASAMIFLNNVNETGGQNPSLFSQAVETNKQMTIAGNNSDSISGAVTDIRLYFDSNPTSGSVYIYRLQTS
jgi:hypothetical protein